jgi:prefoldin subunit 5
MNKIDYMVKEIGILERNILKLTKEREKVENGIQELNNTKSGIDQKLSMENEKLNREYMDLKILFLEDQND